VRELSSAAAADGGAAASKFGTQFARQARESAAERQKRYQHQCQAIFDRQVQPAKPGDSKPRNELQAVRDSAAKRQNRYQHNCQAMFDSRCPDRSPPSPSVDLHITLLWQPRSDRGAVMRQCKQCTPRCFCHGLSVKCSRTAQAVKVHGRP